MEAWIDANGVSIVNGVALGLLFFTMAVGLSLIFGLGGVLNLTHGSFFMIGAYLAYTFSTAVGGLAGLLLALIVAAICGSAAGAGLNAVTRPLAGRGHLRQALLTLGLTFLLSEGVVLIWGSDVRSVQPPEQLTTGVSILGSEYPVYRLVVIGAGAILAAGTWYAFEATTLGARVRAAVEDRAMAEALGIRSDRLLYGVFAFASALAMIGGVIGAPILGARPGLDIEVLILALIVVVIGGMGSVSGSFIGALVIGQIQTLGVSLVPDYAAFLLLGAMAVMLLVRPTGLSGREIGATA